MIKSKSSDLQDKIKNELDLFQDIIKYHKCPECDSDLFASFYDEPGLLGNNFLHIVCDKMFRYSERSGACHFVQNISTEYDDTYGVIHRFSLNDKFYEIDSYYSPRYNLYMLGLNGVSIKVKKDYSECSKQELALIIEKLFILK